MRLTAKSVADADLIERTLRGAKRAGID
jgi:hypothetical protein